MSFLKSIEIGTGSNATQFSVPEGFVAGPGAKIENGEISFNAMTAGKKNVAYSGTASYTSAASNVELVNLSEMQWQSLEDYEVEVDIAYPLTISIPTTEVINNPEGGSYTRNTTVDRSVPATTMMYLSKTDITKTTAGVTVTKELNSIKITSEAGRTISYRVYYVGNVSGGSGTVDQTYDATSTSAQSGTAVAQALSNIAVSMWQASYPLSGQETRQISLPSNVFAFNLIFSNSSGQCDNYTHFGTGIGARHIILRNAASNVDIYIYLSADG